MSFDIETEQRGDRTGGRDVVVDVGPTGPDGVFAIDPTRDVAVSAVGVSQA